MEQLRRTDSPALRVTPLRLLVFAGCVLLVPAIRTQYVGYSSFEPVLFGRLYILAFCLTAFGIPTLMLALRRVSEVQALLLLLCAIGGAFLLSQLAPTIGEPNYCETSGLTADTIGSYDTHGFDWMPPKIFRCTTTPFEVAGALLGWWTGYWLVLQWEAWRAGGA